MATEINLLNALEAGTDTPPVAPGAPVSVPTPTIVRLDEALAPLPEPQSEGPQYSAMNTPLPGTEAEAAATRGERVPVDAQDHPELVQALRNVDLTNEMDPAQEAEFNAIAKAGNMPVELARSMHPDQAKNWLERQDVQFHLQDAEQTRKRMAVDAEAALVFRGEVKAMSATEAALKKLGLRMRPPYANRVERIEPEEVTVIEGLGQKLIDSVITFGQTVPLTYQRENLIQLAQDVDRSFTEIVGDWWSRLDHTSSVAPSPSLLPSPSQAYDLSKRLVKWIGSEPEDAPAHAAEALKISRRLVKLFAGTRASGSTLANAFWDRLGQFDKDASEGERARLLLNLLIDMPGQASIAMGEVVAQQAVPLIGGVTATMATRSAALGVAVATSGAYAQERFGDFNEDLIREFGAGADLNTEAGIADFLSDPARQDFVKGIGEDRAVVIAIASVLGFRLAGRKLASSPLGNVALQVPAQAAAESAGEAAARFFAEQPFDSVETIIEGLAGGVTAPIDILIATQKDVQIRIDKADAEAWLATGEEVKGLLGTMKPHALATASEVLGARLKDEGIQTVYLSAEELISFDQSSPALETLGLDRATVEQAARDGQDIEIGAETYIRHILGKEGFDALIKHTRMKQEGLTPAEAAQLNDPEANGDLAAEFTAALEERLTGALGVSVEEAAVLRDDADAISADMRAQMEALGTMSDREAELNALLTSRRYITRAVRATKALGSPVSALELYLEDGLRIQQGTTQAGQGGGPITALGQDGEVISFADAKQAKVFQELHTEFMERVRERARASSEEAAAHEWTVEVGDIVSTADTASKGISPWRVTGRYIKKRGLSPDANPAEGDFTQVDNVPYVYVENAEGKTTLPEWALVNRFNGPVALSQEGFQQDDVSTGSVEDHHMAVNRGKRLTGSRVVWYEGEQDRITANAEEHGLDPADIEKYVRGRKLAHPAAGAWTPWVYNRTKVELNEETGETEISHEAKFQSYTFNTDRDGKAIEKGSPEYAALVKALAQKTRDEVLSIYRRSLETGDTAALSILRQAGWYKNMRVRLRQEFGGMGDLFADLLGATSPNTPVRGNWDNAVMALSMATTGSFDTLMPQWIAWAENMEQVQGEFKQWMTSELVRRKEAAEEKITDLNDQIDARTAERKAEVQPELDRIKAEQKAFVDQSIDDAIEADPDLSKKDARTAANASPEVAAMKEQVAAIRKEKDPAITSLKAQVKAARSSASKKAVKESQGWVTRKAAMAEARALPEELLPKKQNGNNFGFNGRNVVRALVDLWRVVKDADADIGLGGTKPKALNFSGNLIGFRERATIDVWAARLLQRMAKGNRIPSEAEQSVTGDMLETGETTKQFGLGQDVFAEATKLIRQNQEMTQNKDLAALNDDDLQAIVWFIEKERWAKDDTTSAAGEGGSFEFEADLAGIADRDRIVELRKIIDSKLSTETDRKAASTELNSIKRELDRFTAGVAIQQSLDTQGIDFLPTDGDMAVVAEEIRSAAVQEGTTGIVALKAFSTEGRYGDPERSFDIEVTAGEAYDVNALRDKVFRIAADARQDSAFVSRVLRADEEIDYTKHRPSVEVYFRDMKALGDVQPVLDELAAQGLSFYTVIVDGRGSAEALAGEVPPAVGVRLQYVPEFDARYPEYADQDVMDLSDTDLSDMMQAKGEEFAAMAEQIMSEVSGVNFAGMFWNETEVQFLHEYGGDQDADTTGRAEADTEGRDREKWTGRSVREGITAADQQRRADEPGDGADGADTSGDQGDVDLSLKQDRRGSFTPASSITDQDGNPVNLIQIFEKSDRSTFLHESGHFWLEQLRSDADQFGDSFAKDFKVVQSWWADNADSVRAEALDRARRAKDAGAVAELAAMSDAAVKTFVRSGDLTGSGSSRYLAVAMHEQFARGVEDYFRTGNAPSIALMDAFIAFSQWVKSVYRAMQRLVGRDALDVTFSPEVTAVMDRLLATDEEIEIVASQYELTSLFQNAEEAGMTPEQFAAHLERSVRAKEQAKAKHLSKKIREEERERLKWWVEERAGMQGDVETEVAQRDVYRLLHTITQGRYADGSLVPDAELTNRMDKSILQQFTGKDGLPALGQLPKIRGRAIYAAASKKSPDAVSSPGMVAAMYGYADVSAMLSDIANSPTYEQAVSAELDERMRAKYGAMDDNIIDAAVASVHQEDAVGRVLIAELAALRTSETAINHRFVRAHAASRINDVKMGEASPRSYLSAEKRHAKAAGAALKKGDRTEAYKHQFQRLVNHYMAAEAQKLMSDRDVKLRYMRKFKNKKRKFATIDALYVDQIRAKVDTHDFASRTSNKVRAEANLDAFTNWLMSSQQDDGALWEIPQWLREKDRLVHWRELSAGEFTDLHDSIKEMEKQGRHAKKVIIGAETRDREEVIAEMLARIDGMTNAKAVTERGKHASVESGPAQFLASMDAALLKIEFMLEELDGAPLGPWHQALYQPFADAEARKQDLSAEVSKLIGDGLEALPKSVRKAFGTRIDVGALAGTALNANEVWTRGNLLVLALNVGNSSNLDKVIRGEEKIGRTINEELIDAALDQLSVEEWALIRSIWSHAEKLWPAVEEIYRAENGRSPERVDPREIKTRHGTFSGGYFPLMYDATRSAAANTIESLDALAAMQSQTVRGSVNSSMTKERTQQFAAPISLQVENLTRSFDRTIHFITHYGAVRNANKIILNPDLNDAMQFKLGPEYVRAIKDWVGNIAANGHDAPPMTAVEKVAGWMSRNTTTAVLGFSYTTLAAQILGYTTSVDRLMADGTYTADLPGVMRDLGHGMQLALKPEHRAAVYELSGEMRHRLENTDRDIRSGLRSLKGEVGLRARIAETAMLSIGAMQLYTVDFPTWTAAYNRSMREEQGDVTRAVAYADRVVRMSQSAGGLKDLAAVQRGRGYGKIFTMFYSFMSVMYAILRSIGYEGIRNIKDPLALPRMVARITVVLVLNELAYGALRGEVPSFDPEDEDDDGFAMWLAKKTLTGAAGTLPIARDIIEGMAGDYGYSMSPVSMFGENVARSFGKASNALAFWAGSEEAAPPELKDAEPVVMALSIMNRMPGVQINRTLSGMFALLEGEEDASLFDLLTGYKPEDD